MTQFCLLQVIYFPRKILMNSQMVKSLSLNIPYLRHLDTDLSTILKAAEPFEWDRVNFVLEAS